MSESLSLSALVDLERYPLGDDAGFAPIAERCKAQLKESSFASLPGFLHTGVAEAMTSEVLDAIPRAYRREQSFSAYDEATLEQYPADHVRRRKHESRQFVVATDVLSKAGRLRTLYRDETLTQRIAQMLNEPALFQLADPVMACTSTVLYEGDTHGWHFDLNDFVVSILLQAPEAGGTFDFAPNIRADGGENYPAVAAAIDGRSEGVRSIKVEAGTMLRFSAMTESRVCATAVRSTRASWGGAPPSNRIDVMQGRIIKSNRSALALAGLLTVQTVAVQTAVAQSSGDSLTEIVVTAQRRAERLQDVPAAITALSGDALNQMRLQGNADLAAYVPSLSFDVLGPGETTLTIRGLGTSYGLEPAVSLYVNETPLDIRTDGFAGAPDIDFFDVDRVEVLRGPQGTLYGSSSMGGAVRILTAQPNPSAFAVNAEVGGSSMDGGGLGYLTKSAVNLPLSADAAVRIVGAFEHVPGYIQQV